MVIYHVGTAYPGIYMSAELIAGTDTAVRVTSFWADIKFLTRKEEGKKIMLLFAECIFASVVSVVSVFCVVFCGNRILVGS